jgi:hypothetical protein
MNAWPVPYVPAGQPTGTTAAEPSWSPSRCLDAGAAVARALVLRSDTGDESLRVNTFARKYLYMVRRYHREGADQTNEWAAQIGMVYQNPDTGDFNEHDFANIHRVAWLKILRALARLVAVNPFIGFPPAANPWADPSGWPTARTIPLPTQNHGDFDFTVPNAKGYYAFTYGDLDQYEGAAVGELIDGIMPVWPPGSAADDEVPREHEPR